MLFCSLSRLPAGLVVREQKRSDLLDCLRLHTTREGAPLPRNREAMRERLLGPFSYFVVIELEGKVVACGAVNFSGETNEGELRLGIVQRDRQGQGLGTLLALARLALAGGEHDPTVMKVAVPVALEPFYQRLGFGRSEAPREGQAGQESAEGQVELTLALTRARRDEFRAQLQALPVTWQIQFPEAVPNGEKAAATDAAAPGPMVTVQRFDTLKFGAWAQTKLRNAGLSASIVHENPLAVVSATSGGVAVQVPAAQLSLARQVLERHSRKKEKISPLRRRLLTGAGLALLLVVIARLLEEVPGWRDDPTARRLGTILCIVALVLVIWPGGPAKKSWSTSAKAPNFPPRPDAED